MTDILFLLMDMGYSIEIINKTFTVAIKLTKAGAIIAYDQNLYVSNPENPSLMIAGKLLISLHQELIKKYNGGHNCGKWKS